MKKKNTNLKFCCDGFKHSYETADDWSFNIRILKIPTGAVHPDFPHIRFYVTEGYSKDKKNVAFMTIDYCPFCGKELLKFYNDDKYVNLDTRVFAGWFQQS